MMSVVNSLNMVIGQVELYSAKMNMPGYLTMHGCVFNKMLWHDNTRVL